MNELGMTLVTHHNTGGTMGADAVPGSGHPEFFNAIWAGGIERARQMEKRDEALMRAWLRDGAGIQKVRQTLIKLAKIPE